MTAADAFPELPTIDVGGLWGGSGPEVTAIDARIGDSLAQRGGLVVTGFPDAARLAELADLMLRFFELSDSEKRSVATRETSSASTHIYRGYVSMLEANDFARSEMFDIGPEQPSAGPDLPGMSILEELSQWPKAEPVDGWQQAMRAWYDGLQELAKVLLSSIGRATDLPIEALLHLFAKDNSTLRILNYPGSSSGATPINVSGDGLALASDRHTDGAGLSLLWQAQPGLQAQGPDGTWFAIPARPDAVSIHLGDVLSLLTEGRLPPTPHRVLASEGERRSIGFFLEPSLAAPMRPLSAAGQPVNVRQTYGAELLRRLRSYPTMAPFIPEV